MEIISSQPFSWEKQGILTTLTLSVGAAPFF